MPDLSLRPMTAEEYAAYAESSAADYAQELLDSSSAPDPDAARLRAEETFVELLPDGLDSPGMHLWTALVDDEPVGLGWIELRERPGSVSAYVYDVSLREDRRGQGLGRRLMETLHDRARELGATSIGLNVFGHNQVALALYESLGYQVTARQMRREL